VVDGKRGDKGATCAARAPRRAAVVAMATGTDDKSIVKEYFNQEGFDRWKRIYSEDGEVNNVQKDIRTGHQKTIDTVLGWIDEDGNAAARTMCDAGCGVGSLCIPLAEKGATVFASDISQAMVEEARKRASDQLGYDATKVQFETRDLEKLNGTFDTVCCIDVLIHYPEDKLKEMLKRLSKMTTNRMIISFAPKTFTLGVLKKIGDLFPGPSKATRAYLHSENMVVDILKELGFEVTRRDTISSNFYFSTVLEAQRT